MFLFATIRIPNLSKQGDEEMEGGYKLKQYIASDLKSFYASVECVLGILIH